MEFNEYQNCCLTTMIPPETMPPCVMWTLGLLGEAGEVAEKVKKIHRDDHGAIRSKQVRAITKELGDVLWYLSVLADSLGISMDDVATKNLDKLEKRAIAGRIGGSGDER